MPTLDQDLANLNFEYLMLARESARSNAIEAAWRFGLNHRQINFVEKLTVEKIKEIANSSRAVITLLPLHTPEHIALSVHSALIIPASQNFGDA